MFSDWIMLENNLKPVSIASSSGKANSGKDPKNNAMRSKQPSYATINGVLTTMRPGLITNKKS